MKWISATNGEAGHHQMSSEALIARRRQELAVSAATIGADVDVWDFRDGQLLPDLALRRKIIAEIRSFRPDLVLTHRPWDYHPDHRALGQAVQDACYLVTVPLIQPEVPSLPRDPVVAFMIDLFQRPTPFQPDFVLDVTNELDLILKMIACHESQVFEFLPHSFGTTQAVPDLDEERLDWLKRWFLERAQHRTKVINTESKSLGAAELLEAYEICEYASQKPMEELALLFPGAVRRMGD